MRQLISFRGALHVWSRNIYLYRRTWLMNMVPNFFEPVIYLLGMGWGLGSYIGRAMNGEEYLAFLAPGLVVSNAMNGGAFETTYNLFVKINFNRTYEAITATPINVEDAMLGELMWATTRGTIYGVIFALVIACFGLLSVSGFFLLLPVIVLTAWLFGAIGMMFTTFIKVIDLYSFFYTLFLTPLFLFSGIFFPLDRMPSWVVDVAWFTPLYHAVNLARAAVFGGWGVPQLVDTLWMTALAAVLSVLAIVRLKRSMVR
jgi:lipooligosaccharide transport system permease protein